MVIRMATPRRVSPGTLPVGESDIGTPTPMCGGGSMLPICACEYLGATNTIRQISATPLSRKTVVEVSAERKRFRVKAAQSPIQPPTKLRHFKA